MLIDHQKKKMYSNAKQAIAEHIRNTISNLTGKKQLKAWRPEFIKVFFCFILMKTVNTNWRDICRERNIN